MSWGLGSWGLSPWGISTSDLELLEETDIELSSILLVSKDCLKLTFSVNMKNDTVLKAASSYTISPGRQVVSVRSGNSRATNTVFLYTTILEPNTTYTISVVGGIVDTEGTAINGTASGTITTRRTKVDSILDSRPSMYDTSSTALYRHVLTAIGLEDDLLGGR